MYSLFFIAKNNLKKHKGEVAILFILIFLAACLLFSCLSLMLSSDNTIKECDSKYHFSDLTAFEPSNLLEAGSSSGKSSSEFFKDTIASLPGTALCESVPIVQWAADYYYGNKSVEDAASYQFFLQDSSVRTYLNSYPEEFQNLQDNEIVIPYHLSPTIKVGDPLTLRANGMTFTFTVKGYVEHIYFATTMNISGYYCLISPNVFSTLSTTLEPEYTGSFVYCNVEEGVDLDKYDKSVQNAFPSHAPTTVTRDIMEYGSFAVTATASSIILLFTIMLVGLALIIMHFSIKNFIEMNIQNIGILQANGYTAKELRRSCVIEEMLICVVATVAAVIIGILISPPLSTLQGSLMGLTGFSGICIPALISTLIGIPLMVFLGTLLATRSYKKLTVLDSLRSGISNHNFKKNHFSFDKTKLPTDLALSGKNILGRPKKSIFIALIVALLTFSTVTGFSLLQNFALDRTAMLKLVGFETGDVQIGTGGDQEILSVLESDPRVEHIMTSTSLSSIEVTCRDKTTTLGIDTYNDLSLLQYEYLLEGHLPENGNEVVITYIEAEKLDAKVGDVINIKSSNGEDSIAYTISGIDQKINNMGKKALMSEEGIKRIKPDYKYGSVVVYLKDSSEAKAFAKDWADKYPTHGVMLVQNLIGATIDSLTSAMVAICVLFVFMTCFVVILTEILLTRSQIIRERTEIGVSKALGYTSGELIRRVMLTNIPVIVIGVLFGFLIQILMSNDFMLIGLSAFGIKQNNFTTSPIWFLLTFLIILVCALVTSYLNSRSISKLEPVRILKEE